MVKKIAVEEHCLCPGFEDYWAPTVADMPANKRDGLLARLIDFGEMRLAAMERAGIERCVLSLAGPGVQAEVPDPEDPSTQVNIGLVRTLEEADVVLMAGEALSHCLANTVRDIAAQFSDPRYVAKIHLLRDATGNVPGFESLGDAFVRELTAKGMKLTTTTEFLAAAA